MEKFIFLTTRHSFKSTIFIDDRAIIIIFGITKACDLGLNWFMKLRIKHTACVFKMLTNHKIPP